jgi:hypothetical protein
MGFPPMRQSLTLGLPCRAAATSDRASHGTGRFAARSKATDSLRRHPRWSRHPNTPMCPYPAIGAEETWTGRSRSRNKTVRGKNRVSLEFDETVTLRFHPQQGTRAIGLQTGLRRALPK